MFDRFHRIATSCLEDYVYENCGIEAAEFIETITIEQTPPSCETKERKYSKQSLEDNAQNIQSNFWLILTVLIITLIAR